MGRKPKPTVIPNMKGLAKKVISDELSQVLVDVSFKDAPIEYNNTEASAWAIGWITLKDKIEEILKQM